jgi:hypothetical protein
MEMIWQGNYRINYERVPLARVLYGNAESRYAIDEDWP